MFKDWLNLSWKVLLLRGAIAIVFGIVTMTWPLTGGLAVVFLFGFWALFDGVATGASAFAKGVSVGQRVLLAVLGLLSLGAAFLALFQPISTAVTLTWILGIWMLVRGVGEFFDAFAVHKGSTRWLVVLGGVVDIILGVVFINNPGRSALSIILVLGIMALVWGIVLVASGFALRKQVKDLPEGATLADVMDPAGTGAAGSTTPESSTATAEATPPASH